MSNWKQPPDWHYSFKSRFAWPTPPTGAEAAAGTATNAGAMASGAPPHNPFHHGHGYGYGRGYYYRPRFGLFRRMVWFGLGVGVASWYIHRHDRWNQPGRCISQEGPGPSVSRNDSEQGHRSDHWRKQWQYPQEMKAAAVPASYVAPAPPITQQGFIQPEHESKVLASVHHLEEQDQPRAWGWGARRRERSRRREEAASVKTDESVSSAVKEEGEEVRKIKEAVEKIWAERKQAAVDIQATANEKAKEYARVKLETLSQAVDTLRDALKADAEKREPKLV